LTDVAQVFGHAQILIKAERLRQIADLRTGLACRLSEEHDFARRRFHHAAQNLKDRSLARAIRPD